MKPTRLSLSFATALVALTAAQSARAATLYWDGNNNTANFGSASGTWAAPTPGTATAGWSSNAAGTAVVNGNSITTGLSDTLHFGTDTTSRGLGAGTITVSGTVNANTLRFGNQTTGNIVLSGGTINLGATATIHVGAGGSTVHTISSVLTGAGTSLTKTGNTLTLSGANTYTGSTLVTSGILNLANATPLGTTPGVDGTSGISLSAGTTLSSSTSGTNPSTTIAAPITLDGTGNTTLRIGQGAASNTHSFNLNGAIGGTTGNLVYTTTTSSFSNGSSVFLLGAAGTYTGNTLITTGNGGNNPVTVRAGVANAMPVTTVLSFGNVAGGGSGRNLTYDLNGNSQTLAGLDFALALANDRNIRVSSTPAATLTINNAADFTFGGATLETNHSSPFNTTTSAQITGAISLVKNGTGTFTLGGILTNGAAAQGNAFTGTTTISGGVLVLGESVSIRNSPFDTSGSVAGDTTNGLRVGVGGTGITSLTLGGLTGSNDFATRITTTNGGYGNLTELRLNPGTDATPSYSGDVGNGAGSMALTKTGAGTQTLTGTNTYTGTTTISAGILAVGGGSAIVDTGLVSIANVAAATFQLNNSETIGHLTGGGLTGGTVELGSNTLTLGDATNQTFAGVINGVGGSLTKQGAGALILTNTNGYTGNTVINAGKLVVNGSIGGSNVDLNLGTLTGSGTVGAVVVANDAGAILSNNDGVAGAALTTGNLTFNGAATVNTFSNSTSAAIVSGALSSNVAGTVTITPTGVWSSGVAHDLISYTGGSIGGAGFGQFALGTIGGLNVRQTGGVLGDSGTAITLTVTGDTPVWSGLGTTTWTTATTGDDTGPNAWARKIANTATNFWVGDGVEFNDTYNLGGGPVAVTNTTVTISGGVAPQTTTFNNSAVNYTVTTSDATGITAGSLIKNGTGTVTINNANSYAGGTDLNAGIVEIGNADALGTSGTISFGGGTLRYGSGTTADLSSRLSAAAAQAYRIDTNGNDVTFASALTSLGGTLTKVGSGTLSLTANNTFSGGTTISAGTLQASKNEAVLNALSTGDVSIASGATVVVDILKTTNITDTIANTFTGSGLLKLQFAANPTARNTGMANVTGFSGTIQLSSLGTTGDKWNAPNIGTVPGSLIVDSGNTIFVGSGTTAFTGGTTINGGGNTDNRGAIRIAGATTVFGGDISLASSSTISSENVAAQFTGNIASSVPGSHTLTLGGTSSAGAILSGNISDGTGTIGITQAVGAYTLSGVLSHSGGITVNSALLTLNNPANSYTGATAIAAVANSGVRVYANNALGAVGTGNETTISGLGGTPSGSLRFLDGVNYTALEKVVGSGYGDSRGFIQAAGTGTSTFAGPIELNADGVSRIGTQDGASLTLTGAITQGTGITTASILFRTGSTAGDFVTLSNAGNSFGGDSTVFNAASAGNYAGVRLGVTNGLPINLTISGLTGTGAGTALDMNGKDQTLNGLINGATLNIINQDTLNASTLTLNPTSDKSTTNTTILGGGGLGTINVVKEGAFAQTLGGTNTYTGTTTISGGTLNYSAANNLGDASSATNTIALSGGGQLVQTGAAALDLGANRDISVGTGGGTLAHNNATAATITVSGDLSGSGALGFQSLAAGGGTFLLSGANSGYSGAISVGAASNGLTTLRFENAAAVPGSGSITLNYPAAGASLNATTLNLQNGVALPAGVTLNMTSFLNGALSLRTQVTSAGTASLDGPITVSGDTVVQFNPGTGSTLTINGNSSVSGSFTGTYFVRGTGNGVINGTINIPAAVFGKTDGGTWTINSTGNSWATTALAVGTLNLGATDALVTTAPLNMGNTTGGSTPTLDLSGFNQTLPSIAYSGVGVSTGQRTVTNSALGPASVLTVDNATDNPSLGTGTNSVRFTGNLTLVKAGAGSLTLPGTNTHTGGTSVNGGTLVVGNASALGDAGGNVTVAAGATLDLGGFAVTNTIVNNGGTIIGASNYAPTVAQSLTGTSSYSGTVGGDLTVASSGTLKGTATFTGAVLIQGVHAPGNSPGIQTFGAGVTYDLLSSLEWEFVGDSLALRGTDFDGVDVTGGDMTIVSGASLKLLASGVDYTLTDWDSVRNFTVVDNSGSGTTSGTFSLDTSLAGTFAGQGVWSVITTSGVGGDTILTWTPVPEPSTYAALAGLAALGLAWKRRRRA